MRTHQDMAEEVCRLLYPPHTREPVEMGAVLPRVGICRPVPVPVAPVAQKPRVYPHPLCSLAGLEAPRQPGEISHEYDQCRAPAEQIKGTPAPAFIGHAG